MPAAVYLPRLGFLSAPWAKLISGLIMALIAFGAEERPWRCALVLLGAGIGEFYAQRQKLKKLAALASLPDDLTERLEAFEGQPDEAYREIIHNLVQESVEFRSQTRQREQEQKDYYTTWVHQIKTPIASMKVLADSLLAQNDVPAELYREFLEDIAEEIDRENKIITDLLALVKMDKTVSDMNISVVNINDLTELILKRLRPIARKQDVEVVFESHRVVEAEVDEVKLTLVITNLVENAIKYNRKQGWVKVILDADHQFFTMEICDSGIGIPEDSLDHIYERFYRVDKSHSREIGGTGLGLAITRSAILMHRGSIRVSSVMGEGTTFSIKIPLTYVAS